MNITHGLRRALQINPNGLATVFGNRRRTLARDRRARAAAGRRPARRSASIPATASLSCRSIPTAISNSIWPPAWAGAVIVPLNIRWSPLENEDAMRDCRAGVLIVDKAFASIGAALAKALPGLKLIYADDGDVPAGMEGYEALLRAKRTDSGCDAHRRRPRRHLLHRRHHRPLEGRDAQPRQSDGQCAERARRRPVSRLGRSICTPRRCSISPTARRCIRCCSSGGSNVIIPAFTPEGVMAAVQNERVTDVLLVPTMIQMLVDHPALGSYDLSSLKNIIYGASPISEAVLERATAALPNVQFTQAYGMTELSPIATLLHWNEHIGDGRAKGRHRGAGRATLGCEVRIVDPDNKPVPYGTVGEIIVRGDNVMMGYWERPGRNRRAPSSTAGCIPATAATWTKTDSSSSSTGSRT